MNFLQYVIQPFIMAYNLEEMFFKISPVTFLIFNIFGAYIAIGLMICNIPIIELITFGLIKNREERA